MRLAGRDRAALLEAAFWLLAADLSLRALGLARTRRLLACVGSGRARAGAEVTGDEAARIARWVGAASRHHLYPMTCLRQALALQHVLRRRGMATELCLGVRREGEAVRAHAWLEHAGRPVCVPAGGGTRHTRLARAGAGDPP